MLSFRRGRIASLVSVLLLCAFFLFQLRADAGEFLIDTWATENGLPDNFVTSLAQTADGYLWIGTYNGLARFDGVRFVIFNPVNTPQLAHARIVKLFVDAQGVLWINTYDGSLTSWCHGVFTMEWNGKGKNISEVWLVSDNSSRIAFAFRSGLLISRPVGRGADKQDWRILEPPGNPPGAFYCQDQTGVLWCSTLDNKIWRVTDGRFESMTKGSGLCGQEIHWLSSDSAGHIWVATEKEMAIWNDGHFQNMTPGGGSNLNVAFMFFTGPGEAVVEANGQLRTYRDGRWVSQLSGWPDLTQEQQLWPSLYADRAGGFWQITRGSGILHIGQDGIPRQFTVADGLPSDHVTCWLEDREGNFWIGLGRGGLARLRQKHFEVFGRAGDLPIRPAVSVCEDKTGAIWMGTYGGGLNCWCNGVLTNYPLPKRASDGLVFSAYPDSQGQLWISAGMEDLFVFTNGQLLPAPTAVHGIKSILVDRHDRIWMGRKDGVACWAEGKLRKWDSHGGSIAKPVRGLAEDRQGSIWVGADDGNLYRFDGDNLRAFPLPQFSAPQAIWSLLADADGTLWIGTSSAGLLHFENGHFTRFTVNDGLPDDIICQILDDQQGNLWVGSHHGIFRASKAALHAFAAGQASTIACSVYGLSDGLPSLQCSDMYQPSAWRGHDGRLWFATAKGVVAVQPEKIPLNAHPPPVIIEEFSAGGKVQTLPEARHFGSDGLMLETSPGKQDFEFRYTALSLTDSEKVRFRYRLEGFDTGWINAGTRRWAHYSYLKPGRYRFHVLAANNDGLWNETGAVVGLRVLPYFWETWWFFTLLMLLLLTGVAGMVRHLSQRQLRRQLENLERQRTIERDRARIARDIHDHIGSGLTRINLLNGLLLSDPAGLLPGRVGQITSVTCELMRAMDEIVWAVNPKNDTLESLVGYLCDYADEYLRAAGIRLRLNVPVSLPVWHLTSEVRHNLFLAIQEILNNIVKHSQAAEVCFGLQLHPGEVTLEIQDDGRGFRPEPDSLSGFHTPRHAGGNGLDNLQKRAAAIGGRYLICSAPGQGTQIKLTVPSPRRKLAEFA